jgi:hypothetical protein
MAGFQSQQIKNKKIRGDYPFAELKEVLVPIAIAGGSAY